MKLKRQQAAGLKGDIVLHKSYSKGKFIVKEAEKYSFIHLFTSYVKVNKGKLKVDWKTSQKFSMRIGATETVPSYFLKEKIILLFQKRSWNTRSRLREFWNGTVKTLAYGSWFDSFLFQSPMAEPVQGT